MTTHFFKSDFTIRESCGDYETHPFQIVFWTESPKETWVCSWDGNEYRNCEVDADGALVVRFHAHSLAPGILKAEKTFFVPGTDGKTSKLSSVGYYDVRLTIQAGDIITDESTTAVFNGSIVTFPSGKTEINDDDAEMLNDVNASVSGTTLNLDI